MSSTHPARTALSILFMLLFLAALGVYAWASTRSHAIVGPSHLAVTADGLHVHVGDELVMLSPDGALRTRRPAAALGLTDMPIDLRGLPDGRVLVAEQRPARLLACAAVEARCDAYGGEIAGHYREQYKLIPAGDGDLLIADNRSGRVWRQPSAGGAPTALTAAGALDNINDLLRDRDGRIWVADSGHRRLVALEATRSGVWQVATNLKAANVHGGAANDWPMMLALDDAGQLWSLQWSSSGPGAAVVVYDPRRGAIARIALPEDGLLTDIARLDGAMIVSDMERFRLYRVDIATRAVTPFGDAGFEALLNELRQRRHGYELGMRAAIGAMALFAALMIGAAIWATPKGKRFPKPARAAPLAATDAAMPEVNGIRWLARSAQLDRSLKLAKFAAYALPFAFIALAYLSFGLFDKIPGTSPSADDLAKIDELKRMLVFCLLVFAGTPVLIHFGIRNMSHTLGTDGRRLYAKLVDGTQLALMPEQLAYGNRQIVHEGREFLLQNGLHQSVYADGEIETYIAPLLQRAKKLGAFELLRYKLRHREPMLIATWIYVLLIAAGTLATGAWKMVLN